MKITKRQLRRIIREERDAILEGPGRRKYGKGRHYNAFGQKIYKSPAPKKSIDHRFVYEYEMWVEDFGQGAENPSHPGVMASYFLEKGLEDDHEKHEALGNLYGVDHEDIMKELKLQLAQVPLPLEESKMKITKRQLLRVIREATSAVEAGWTPWLEARGLGAEDLDDLAHFTGAPDRSYLDAEPPVDGMIGPADIESWAKNKALKEGKVKVTKRQLRRIIKETIKMGEPITLRPGSAFNQEDLKYQAPKKRSTPGDFKDTIVMSPTGDSVLVGGEETGPDELDIRLYEIMDQQLPPELESKLARMVMKQMADGYVEIPISWSPNTGWKF